MTDDLDHVVLWVEDRGRGLDFYERVLGFPCCNQWREEGGIFANVLQVVCHH